MNYFMFFSVILFSGIGTISFSNAEQLIVTGDDNINCIVAEFSGKISYMNGNQTDYYLINGTVNANKSHCGDEQVLSILNDGNTELEFHFAQDNSSVMVSLIKFIVNDNEYNSEPNKISFSNGHSYKCDSGIDADLIDANSNQTMKLELRSVRLDAFRNSTNTNYQQDEVCSSEGWSNKTIPMIIAFVLAGMVVIMLVGYIILRKREDRTTYQTV